MKFKQTLLTILAGSTTALIAEDILSQSEVLNLDFKKAVSSIEKITESTKPMTKHLEEGNTKLQQLVKNVKGNPNVLNKSKFEVAFAQHMSTITEDIDDIISHKQEIKWAFDDIKDEVVQSDKRLKHLEKRQDEKIKRAKEKETNLRSNLRDMAKELKREGKEASLKKQLEFKKLVREHKLMQKTMRLETKAIEQLRSARKVIAALSNGVGGGSEKLENWFQNLQAQRDAFSSIAKSRSTISKLWNMMEDGNIASVAKVVTQFNSIVKNLDKMTETLDQIDGNFDLINEQSEGVSVDINFDSNMNLDDMLDAYAE